MLENETRRPAGLALLVCAFAAYSLAHLFNNTVLELDAPRRALVRLQLASGGWIEPVLVRSQVVLLAFLLVVVVLGRRRMAEIGWRARDVVPGLLVYSGAWLVLQLGLVAAALRQGVELAWHPRWAYLGVGTVLGGVLTQALGHALVEDTFRTFLLQEIRGRLGRPRARSLVFLLPLLAVLGSALLCGLAHAPTRFLLEGSGLGELLREQGHFLSAGLALGVAYLVTRNLFAVVGLHVLLEAPAPLVDVPGTVIHSAVLVVLAGAVALAALRRFRAGSTAAKPPEDELRRAA